MGLAASWQHEATGAITADVPVDTPNARAAADSFREIQALLAAAGVPPRGLTMHRYHPEDPRQMAAIRLSYPKIKAVAGPCGLWPEDLGPSVNNKGYYENKSVLQFRLRLSAQHGGDGRQSVRPGATAPRNASLYGATQRRLSRNIARARPTTTTYPEAEKAKLSDTGK